MSVQRSFAQRNNNVVDLVPVKATSGYWNGHYLLNIDPRNCSTFNVDLTVLDITNTDNSFINQVDVEGYLTNVTNADGIDFAIIVDPTIATSYPDLEFTVNFVNTNYNLDSNTFVSVCADATLIDDGNEKYMRSPLRGFDWSTTQSLTFKSNGTKFTVISSGPTSWNKWC